MKNIQVIDYRKKFKTHYNIDFSDQFDVHHIDLNHDNNDIDNLMILPKELHKAYHDCLIDASFMTIKNTYDIKIDCRIRGNEANQFSLARTYMENFIYVLRSCSYWYDFKQYLDGKIPRCNITTAGIIFLNKQEK